MRNLVKFVIKVFILIVYLIAILFILESHYVAMGECAARVYFYPLGRCDYLLIPLMGIALLSISLYLIPVSIRLRIIEVFIYASIIIATLLMGNDILASRTIDWPEKYKAQPIVKNVSINDAVNGHHERNNLLGFITNKDSVFLIIEGKIISELHLQEYSYSAWKDKTYELFTPSIYDYNDFDYISIENNILAYLNWHLVHRIAGISEIDKETLKRENSITDSLLKAQYGLINKLFIEEDNRYAYCSIKNEMLSIRNYNLENLFNVFTIPSFTYKQWKITELDSSHVECGEIEDSQISKEYLRFIMEDVPYLDDCPRMNISDVLYALEIEKTKWEELIKYRNSVEKYLTGTKRNVWHYGTKLLKINKIIQLKNGFDSYGTQSEETIKILLNEDYNYSQIMAYPSFSAEWKKYINE